MLHVFAGNALRDQSFRIQGTVDPLNVLLGKIQFTSDSDFNNAMGTNLENLTVSVKDTTATYTMLQQGGWGCAQGGYTGTFTPMWLMVARKPLK